MLNLFLTLIFIIVLLKIAKEIGFVKSVLIYACISAVANFLTTWSILSLVTGFISDIITGAIGYVLAMVFLAIISFLGAIGSVIVAIILGLMFFGLIFLIL